MAWVFLVVDDNAPEAARTVQQLRQAQPGAEILVAESGEAALALLETKRVVPSLIFLDFAMPGMNGIQFLGQLRERRWLEGAAVSMLSEAVPDRIIVSCYRLGVSAFLTKPVPAYDLRATIRDFAVQATWMTAATVVPTGSAGAGEAAA